MGDLLGYTRVSTLEQNPDLQRDALKAAGCYRVFTDKASGSLDARPQLAEVLDQLRLGDTLAVWRLLATKQLWQRLEGGQNPLFLLRSRRR